MREIKTTNPFTEKTQKDSDNENNEQRPSLHACVVKGAENIVALRTHWDELFDRVEEAPVYLSRAWTEEFIKGNRFEGTPLIIAVWSNSKLVGLFALAIRRILGIRVAKPLTTGWASILGPLVDPEYVGVFKTIVDIWTQQKVSNAFFINDLSSIDKYTNRLMEEFKQRGFASRHTHRNIVHWTRLGRSFDKYLEETKSAKSRQTLRRKERLLHKGRKVMVQYYIGKEVTGDIIERLAEIQRESWMKRRGAAFLSERFFQNLSLEMAKAGFARAWVMTIDGDDAAFVYALVAHKKLLYIWTAFKLKYDRLNVGNILTYHSIQDACEEGILSFDFGHGDAEYKQFWSTDNYYIDRAIVGMGFIGHLLVLFYSTLWWLRRCERLHRIYSHLRRWAALKRQSQSTNV
jgi:CelD/BcsL family acetyltransferase involved in cellulose biosynthesis